MRYFIAGDEFLDKEIIAGAVCLCGQPRVVARYKLHNAFERELGSGQPGGPAKKITGWVCLHCGAAIALLKTGGYDAAEDGASKEVVERPLLEIIRKS